VELFFNVVQFGTVGDEFVISRNWQQYRIAFGYQY
jgi:hypothetical protein